MKIASLRTKINLGIFVLGVIALGALALFVAGDHISFFKAYREYNAHFKNTSGLVSGAPVRMGGVEVGRVTQILIASEDGDLAIVASLRIDSPFFELLRTDASVALDTQGLLGDKFVALSGGSANTPLEAGARINTREGEGLAQVVAKSNQIMESVERTTQKVDAFAAGLPDAVMLKTLASDFSETAKAMRVLITRMNSQDSILATLRDPKSKAQLKQGLESFASAAEHVESIAKKIDEGQGTLGALVNDRALYEDMRSLLGHNDRGKVARRIFHEAGVEDAKAPAPPAKP